MIKYQLSEQTQLFEVEVGKVVQKTLSKFKNNDSKKKEKKIL